MDYETGKQSLAEILFPTFPVDGWATEREELINALRSAPRVLKEIGGELSLDLPDLCAELSKQHRTAKRDRSIARQEAQCRRLEEIFNEIVRAGHYPSRRRINRHLVKESMSLAQDHLNQALRKLFQAPPREEATKDDAP